MPQEVYTATLVVVVPPDELILFGSYSPRPGSFLAVLDTSQFVKARFIKALFWHVESTPVAALKNDYPNPDPLVHTTASRKT